MNSSLKRPDSARTPSDPARRIRSPPKSSPGCSSWTSASSKLNRLSRAFHYGLAIQWAALYPLLRRRTSLSPLTAGLATGGAMSVIADELMTPAFGFSAPNLEYPLVTHVRGFAAHLAFGVAVAAVFEAVWTVTRDRP